MSSAVSKVQVVVILYHILSFTPCAFSFKPALQCHEHEASALLHFKDSFVFYNDWCTSYGVEYFPKVDTWNLLTPDCCKWEGVRCDPETNHVISLELSCGVASIHSNSSLFRLVHLQSLILAHNDFRHSQIPPEIGNFSALIYLDLSHSNFSGQVPVQLSNLSTLVSLDLSQNIFLMLQKPSLKDVFRGFSSLKLLHLDDVNISSRIPHDLFSRVLSLESLSLVGCYLQGEFPVAIFNLPNIRILHIGYNFDLKGNLPEFQSGSHLKSLTLSGTGISGVIPPSIGNLVRLEEFYISLCGFTGKIPSSIGNLTQLVRLNLFHNQLFGPIPPTLWNLTSLEVVDLSSNRFSGKFPSQINQLTNLRWLYLSSNNLEGFISTNLSNLRNLEVLNLHSNNLSGLVDLNIFLQITSMTDLVLSFNNLSVLSRISTSPTITNQLVFVGLASCNLTEFPSFLRNQHHLLSLDLSSNNIHGKVPSWMLNLSTISLDYLNLSHNHLTGFEHDSGQFQWERLRIIDLRFNLLQGPLPAAPPLTMEYLISHNNLSGQISPSLCQLNYLEALDLSFNNFGGDIPQCLSTSSVSLSLLNLRRNNFGGGIPSTWNKGCRLIMLSMSYNQLQGQIPKSLVNCTYLQLIDISYNRLADSFPSWIGSLTQLQILLLRMNHFYGEISQATYVGFHNLRIIDLSYNNFSGELQSSYFQNWNAMKIVNENNVMAYLSKSLVPSTYFLFGELFGDYDFSIIMYIKGLETNYAKIPDILTAIDFSNNRFEGEIPEIIGNLKALYMLNLSNNNLQGKIPSSLSNLTSLEGLDLSENRLSGEIPWQLTTITTLSAFNVSFNNLSGRIPQGQQFCTFDDTSFEGNPGLFSDRSRNQCGNYKTMPIPIPPSSTQNEDSGSGTEWNWTIILMGFGSGVIVGIVAGNEFVIRKRDWLLKVLPGKKQTRTRQRRNRN